MYNAPMFPFGVVFGRLCPLDLGARMHLVASWLGITGMLKFGVVACFYAVAEETPSAKPECSAQCYSGPT
jgi:hypothetical protein